MSESCCFLSQGKKAYFKAPEFIRLLFVVAMFLVLHFLSSNVFMCFLFLATKMTSSLDHLKKFTTVVADTGDFEGTIQSVPIAAVY